MNTTAHVVDVRQLTYTYPKTTEPAVRGMDFTVSAGEIFGFLGPSGAGKSTTQKLLIGLLRGHGGQALVWGKDPLDWGSDYYQRIGVSFELPNHYLKLTGAENLRFFASLYDGQTREPRELLEAVGLTGVAMQAAGSLPYGHKRALELATTLAMDPQLMLLDEPTQGMGHEDVDRVTQLIKKVSVGRTILMVEHNTNVVSSIADRITVLQRGAIIADGPYAEVSKNPLVIEAYMGTADAALAGAH